MQCLFVPCNVYLAIHLLHTNDKIEIAMYIKYTSELRADELIYSVTHQYLKMFSYGFWGNQCFGRNQICLKLKLGALQFMPEIKNLNLNFFYFIFI
jgi:hypothetical protein